MTYFASCFLVALLVTLLIMRSSIRHSHLSADHDLSGPQKFHSRAVPRVGGAGVMAAMAAGALIAQVSESPATKPLWLLITCILTPQRLLAECQMCRVASLPTPSIHHLVRRQWVGQFDQQVDVASAARVIET